MNRKKKDKPSVFPERLGKRFGNLTVVDFAYYKLRSNGKDREIVWLCECDCGTKNVFVKNCNLLSGNSCSCGCLKIQHYKKLHEGNIKPDAPFLSVYREYKRSAKDNNREFNLSLDDFFKITKSNCYYCGIEPYCSKHSNGNHVFRGEPYIYNGIDRLDNSKGYILENCLPCCRKCNISKATMTLEEFKIWLNRLCEFKDKW